MDAETFAQVAHTVNAVSAAILQPSVGIPHAHIENPMGGERVCVIKWGSPNGVTISQYLDPSNPNDIIIRMHVPNLMEQVRSQPPSVDYLEALYELPEAEEPTSE